MVHTGSETEHVEEAFWSALLLGLTVSLLIGELAFDSELRAEHVKVGVLVGSVVASLLASVLLRARNRAYRTIEAQEAVDADSDGVPDVFQEPR